MSAEGSRYNQRGHIEPKDRVPRIDLTGRLPVSVSRTDE